MMSVSQVEHCLKHILEERADVLARELGCIKRQRKFSGRARLSALRLQAHGIDLIHDHDRSESAALANDTPIGGDDRQR